MTHPHAHPYEIDHDGEHPGGHPGGHPHAHHHKHPVVRHIHHDINEKPFIVIWEVTRACGLACAHCRATAQPLPHPGQLTTEQGKKLLDQIAEWERPRPMIVFTGGDCFEREDLVELTQYGTDIGLHVSISPSVTPLFTRERLEALRAAGGNAMSVSLDGATAETHDAFRGFSGTFEKTIEACKIITDVGFRLQVNTTLTKGNIHEAPQMLKNALDFGAFMWYTFMLVPTGRGADLNMLSPDEREDVLHWIHDNADRIAMKTTEAQQYRRIAIQRERDEEAGMGPDELAHPSERGELYHWLTAETTKLIGAKAPKPRSPRPPLAINSGSGFVFVSHLGDVYPSGFLPIKVGNVKETHFHDLYKNTKVMKDLRTPSKFGGKCGVCEFNDVCGGSRSTAYALTGDYMAADPTCAYIPPGYVEEK